MNPATVPWLVEVGIISWRNVRNYGAPPVPSQLLATFIIFGGLNLLGQGEWKRPAAAFGWGLVIATFMEFVDPTFTHKLQCGQGTETPGSKPSTSAGNSNVSPSTSTNQRGGTVI